LRFLRLRSRLRSPVQALEEVKSYLGHSSIRVTSDRYRHLFPKARETMRDGLDRAFTDAQTHGSCAFFADSTLQ
jgi:integrase